MDPVRRSVPTRPTDPLLLAVARQAARNSRWSFYGKAKAGWGNLGHVGMLDEPPGVNGPVFRKAIGSVLSTSTQKTPECGPIRFPSNALKAAFLRYRRRLPAPPNPSTGPSRLANCRHVRHR